MSEEQAESTHNGFSKAISVLAFNNYLPLITTALNLNTKNHFLGINSKVATTVHTSSSLCTQEPTSPKQTLLILSAMMFLHAMTCPSFGSQLHKVQGFKKAKQPSSALLLLAPVVPLSHKAEVAYHKPTPSEDSSKCPQPAAQERKEILAAQTDKDRFVIVHL